MDGCIIDFWWLEAGVSINQRARSRLPCRSSIGGAHANVEADQTADDPPSKRPPPRFDPDRSPCSGN